MSNNYRALQEKEAAEAEIEILNAEKTEVEAVIENMNHDLESGQKDIEEQKEILKEITDQISDAEKKVVAKEKALDKILDAGKSVEKEIEEIKSQVSDVMSLFGGEPMVKFPKKTFEKMISRYRVAGTFENLNRQYVSAIEAKDKTIAGLKEQISSLKSKVREFTDFVSEHGLMEVFREFIRPKSMKEKLEIGKQKSREMESQKRNLTVIADKKHDIAIAGKDYKMNSYGVLTMSEEFEVLDDRSYETLKEKGVFELKLIFRGWYRKAFSMGLICYFETADGKRCKLFCFRHTKNGEDQYCPKRCEIDFEKVKDGTWWRCAVEKNGKGNYTWVAAEMME